MAWLRDSKPLICGLILVILVACLLHHRVVASALTNISRVLLLRSSPCDSANPTCVPAAQVYLPGLHSVYYPPLLTPENLKSLSVAKRLADLAFILRPSDPHVLLVSTEADVAVGLYSDAAQKLDQILQRGGRTNTLVPGSATWHLLMARVEMQREDWQETLRQFREAQITGIGRWQKGDFQDYYRALAESMPCSRQLLDDIHQVSCLYRKSKYFYFAGGRESAYSIVRSLLDSASLDQLPDEDRAMAYYILATLELDRSPPSAWKHFIRAATLNIRLVPAIMSELRWAHLDAWASRLLETYRQEFESAGLQQVLDLNESGSLAGFDILDRDLIEQGGRVWINLWWAASDQTLVPHARASRY